MSAPADLLTRCRALDIRLWVEGGMLRYDAPRGALDAELRADLVAHKPEVNALLAPPPPAATVARDAAAVQPDRSSGPPAIDGRPAEATLAAPADVGQADPFDRLTVCQRTSWGWRWSDPDAPSMELFDGEPEPWRWRCSNPYCRHKGRWWMSAHRVVNCSNCRPPSFPWLVIAEGDAEDAPFVGPSGTDPGILVPRDPAEYPTPPKDGPARAQEEQGRLPL
jgi:hypothetical protein